MSTIATEMFLPPASRITGVIRDNRFWIMAMGVGLMLMGAAAIIFPVSASFAVNMTVGVILTASGIIELIRSARMCNRNGVLFSVFNGLLALGIGMLLLLFPLSGVITLALVVTAFFLIGGILRIALAMRMRPYDHWGWIFISGLLAMTLGVLILLQWPTAAGWIIGMLVGIDLIFAGWNSVFLAMRARLPAR